mmetsp:Transcript_45463/g.71250  ORF Transcript_45463/g.71250 Transcript_45463/m.71250 type:complete len:237 (+) Transcript_45463:223-933(+)
MPLGELTERRKRAMKARENPTLHKTQYAPMPWSTGLCDLWTDPELLYMASHGFCGICCFVCLPAKTYVDLVNGLDVWRRKPLPGRTSADEVAIRGAFGINFSAAGWAMLWNAFILSLFPPIRIYWRWRLRQKYVVQGALYGDAVAVTVCYFCSALQEQREIRIEQDGLFAAVKGIDGAKLPTSYQASFGISTEKSDTTRLPQQMVMSGNKPVMDSSAAKTAATKSSNLPIEVKNQA